MSQVWNLRSPLKPDQNRTGRLCKMSSRKIGTLTVRVVFFFFLGGGGILYYKYNKEPPQNPILIIKALAIPRLLKAAWEDPGVKGFRVQGSGLYGFGLGFRV